MFYLFFFSFFFPSFGGDTSTLCVCSPLSCASILFLNLFQILRWQLVRRLFLVMKWVVLSKKKKEIPLFHILNATATFQNFEERPIEDSIFDLPKSHKHVNFVKKRKNMADYVNEADEKNAEKSAASDKSNTSDSLPPSDEEQQPSDEER